MWARPTEGRLAIVTDAGRDAVDADGASDEGARGGRRSRVVLTPRRWRQVGGSDSVGGGDNRACLLHYTRGCGCIGHPAFPTPSVYRARLYAQLGRTAPRECGRVWN